LGEGKRGKKTNGRKERRNGGEKQKIRQQKLKGKRKNTQTYSSTHTEGSVGLILSREWKKPVHEVMKESYSNISRRRLDNPADSRTAHCSQRLISLPRG